MLTTDRSAQAELCLFVLFKAKAFSNVMRQGFEDQQKGSTGGKSMGVGGPGKQLLWKTTLAEGTQGHSQAKRTLSPNMEQLNFRISLMLTFVSHHGRDVCQFNTRGQRVRESAHCGDRAHDAVAGGDTVATYDLTLCPVKEEGILWHQRGLLWAFVKTAVLILCH